ncbi:murein biosynthesis integral membrane protein MurJ [Brevibacillus humidisoli]|uniref:murein biosynthesis integral membrane protein MurJ n=1 Tax=Brevibacillus humidisoli TaxID=2895522 RepID=UPI001E43CAD8|nr:murein biosynthesis integral membrane protein MurJ [Brevibacillus humidisoli]UFJ39147.1 murein biosynthesis integral membrane protein MurJ [Brevibacillus humidisoli]
MSRFQQIVAMVFVLSLLGRVLGFVRNLFVSSTYGTSIEASAYYAAVVIPMTLWIIFPTVVNSLYIPTMKGLMTAGEEQRGHDLYSKLFTLTILIGGGVSLFGWLLNGPVTNLLVPGFSAAGQQLVATQLGWMWPSVLFIALLSLWSSLLNARDRFFASSLSTVVNAAVTILCFYLLVPMLGSTGLAIATTIGFALAAATLLPSVLSMGMPFRLNFRWRGDPLLHSMGERFIPILFALILGQITVFFEKMIGSGLGEAKISALAYAMTIVQLPMMVVGAATVPLFPLLSEYVKQQNLQEMNRVLTLGLRYLLVLLVPISVGFFLLGKPLIEMLYQNNNFGPEDTALTYWALIFYGIGLFAIAARDLFTRAFYALENTRTPVIFAAVNVALFISLGLLLVPWLDHGGIALAMSLSAFLNIALLAVALRRRVGPFLSSDLFKTAGKTTMAVLVMTAAVMLLKYLVPLPYAWLRFFLYTGSGALVYACILYLVKEPLLAEILGKVWKKAARRGQ